jgi:hypothetical protein
MFEANPYYREDIHSKPICLSEHFIARNNWFMRVCYWPICLSKGNKLGL